MFILKRARRAPTHLVVAFRATAKYTLRLEPGPASTQTFIIAHTHQTAATNSKGSNSVPLPWGHWRRSRPPGATHKFRSATTAPSEPNSKHQSDIYHTKKKANRPNNYQYKTTCSPNVSKQSAPFSKMKATQWININRQSMDYKTDFRH